jgi:uncharacterized protein YegL
MIRDRIAKQQLNVIILVDTSKSMQGERIAQVNCALRDIRRHLVEMQNENANVAFCITVIPFSNDACFLNGDRSKEIELFDFKDLKGGGWSNLHLAYQKLSEVLVKESKGGIMPDFGGVAPIILLMTDGHPTKYPISKEMNTLKQLPWFNAALKYGIAIMLNDERTHSVLEEFVSGSGDVIDCYDAALLKNIIQIIILTASKVKSSTTAMGVGAATPVSKNAQVVQQVKAAIDEVNDWEW